MLGEYYDIISVLRRNGSKRNRARSREKMISKERKCIVAREWYTSVRYQGRLINVKNLVLSLGIWVIFYHQNTDLAKRRHIRRGCPYVLIDQLDGSFSEHQSFCMSGWKLILESYQVSIYLSTGHHHKPSRYAETFMLFERSVWTRILVI